MLEIIAKIILSGFLIYFGIFYFNFLFMFLLLLPLVDQSVYIMGFYGIYAPVFCVLTFEIYHIWLKKKVLEDEKVFESGFVERLQQEFPDARVFHDIRIKFSPNIDLVMVTKKAVYLLDIRGYVGEIIGKERKNGWKWKRPVRVFKTFWFKNPVIQMKKLRKIVKKKISVENIQCLSVFSDSANLKIEHEYIFTPEIAIAFIKAKEAELVISDLGKAIEVCEQKQKRLPAFIDRQKEAEVQNSSIIPTICFLISVDIMVCLYTMQFTSLGPLFYMLFNWYFQLMYQITGKIY